MAYPDTIWENTPSTNSPINADNLNKMEKELVFLDNLTSEINSDFLDFAEWVYPSNIYNRSESTNGCRLQSNGLTYETPEYFTSGYIDVSFVGNNKLFLGVNNYGINFYYVCFYDKNKQILSYSSTVANNIQNNTNAKYMRFSAQATYYSNEYVYVSYGTSRAASYSAYFKPYLSIKTDDLEDFIDATSNDYEVLYGYSNASSAYPEMVLKSGQITVKVSAYLYIVCRKTGEVRNVSTYNSNPQTFTVSNNNFLVFDLSDNTIKIISSATSLNKNTLILLYVSNMSVASAGLWLHNLWFQIVGQPYKEPIIPYMPRKVSVQSSSYAGDQSIVLMNDWLINIDGEDTDGLINILNKDTLERIKLMTHSLGHAFCCSYCKETDSLIFNDTSKSYILQNATDFIENNETITTSDCVEFSTQIGTFGETEAVTYNAVLIATADTLANCVIYKYSLEIVNGEYTGNSTLLKTYTSNYRIPILQDSKFHNGYLYLGVGYRKAIIFKINFDNVYNKFYINESFDIPNGEGYELEGVEIVDDKIFVTTRLVSDITQKFIIDIPIL